MAGVKGRSGRRQEQLWRDAIRLAISRMDKGDQKALDRLALALIDKALEGDMQALKEVGDRLDGKPAQQITLEGTGEDGAIGMVVTGVRRAAD